MSPNDKAARALALGWRIVATLPSDPTKVTYEDIAPLFSGDDAALAEVARLTRIEPLIERAS